MKNNFDIIIANPPFGTDITLKNHSYLNNFKLAQVKTGENGKFKVRETQESEIIFIEKCLEYLKPGTGKMAIVLHDGILNNSSLKYVRDYILAETQILAINPWKTSAKPAHFVI